MSFTPWTPPPDLYPPGVEPRPPDTHTSFLFEADLIGGHVHVKVRAATRHPSVQVDHSRGLCGELVMTPVEWILLRAALDAVPALEPLWLMVSGGAKFVAPAGASSDHEGQTFLELKGWPEISSGPVELTKERALELIRERAYTITNPGRTIIHTRAGGFGADWDVEDAERYIEASKEVLWVDSLVGHNLAAVSPEGRVVCFDVPREEDGK